jgi:uncharacterized protein (DUF433 family)
VKSTVEKQSVPLSTDDDGVFRVGGTRVTLETVVSAFESGCTCEEIAQQYTSLNLSDIYLVIGYYLTHRDELQTYLDRRAAQQDKLRSEAPLAPQESNREIRQRLLKRRRTG